MVCAFSKWTLGWLVGRSGGVSGWVSVRLIGWPGLAITIIIVSRGSSASLVTICRTGSIILAATFQPHLLFPLLTEPCLSSSVQQSAEDGNDQLASPFRPAINASLLLQQNLTSGYFKLSSSNSHATSADDGMVFLKFIINTNPVESGHIIICIGEQKETRFCVSEKNYPISIKINKNSNPDTRKLASQFFGRVIVITGQV